MYCDICYGGQILIKKSKTKFIQKHPKKTPSMFLLVDSLFLSLIWIV